MKFLVHDPFTGALFPNMVLGTLAKRNGLFLHGLYQNERDMSTTCLPYWTHSLLPGGNAGTLLRADGQDHGPAETLRKFVDGAGGCVFEPRGPLR